MNKIMKRVFIALLLFAVSTAMFGQSEIKKGAVDTTLVGRSVFDLLSDRGMGEGSASVVQPASLGRAMDQHIRNNSKKDLMGYRVRIFFDNSQSARAHSASIADSFAEAYPDVPVYLTHVNPYFKVAVGDFRTKADAQKFSKELKGKYPSVFIVKEAINYPIAE